MITQKAKYHIKAKYSMTADEQLVDKAIRKEGLHIKHEWQIAQMLTSHAQKVPVIEEKLLVRQEYPRWRVKQLVDNGRTKEEAEIELQEELDFYQSKVDRLNEAVYLLNEDLQLRLAEKVNRSPIGTTYYIDADNGSDDNSGLDTVQSSAVNISATTASNDQVTTSSAHGLITGDEVVIAGNTGTTPDINGANQAITVVDTTNFTIDGVTITVDGNADGTVQEEDGPWASLTKFMAATRVAGDIVKIRRGTTARIDTVADINPFSDGTLKLPLQVEADYDDNWSDEVDLSATATATFTFGSKTVTYSSDISGVLAAGDWIFASGDDNREFAYEVKTVSTVTVTLHLPYKGGQAGSGKTTTSMPSSPKWNTPTGSFQINIDADNFWKFQGIEFSGTDANGAIEIDLAHGTFFFDCTFVGNATQEAINATDRKYYISLIKCRMFDFDTFFEISSNTSGYVEFESCLFDANSNANTRWVSGGSLTLQRIKFIECEEANLNGRNVVNLNQSSGDIVEVRNSDFSGAINQYVISSNGQFIEIKIEDFDSTLGDNRLNNTAIGNSVDDTYQVVSETTKVRSGGSNKSIKVVPTIYIGTLIPKFSFIKVLEIPIYATTASKTYTVFFASDTITEWTTGPTAGELYIELDAWGHASNNFRKVTKSTGTVDFTTDTDFDQSLSVTVAPAQAGVAYLRVWYGKTKEAADTNVFYVDPIPVIT